MAVVSMFQEFVAGEEDSGYGDAYGDAYGGTLLSGEFVILPPNEVPGQYLGDQFNVAYRTNVEFASVEHRRHGLLIGERTYAPIYVWDLHWRNWAYSDVRTFALIVKNRRFKFIPNINTLGNWISVHWRGPFRPRQRRGAKWEIDGQIETYA